MESVKLCDFDLLKNAEEKPVLYLLVLKVSTRSTRNWIRQLYEIDKNNLTYNFYYHQ